MRMFLSGLNCNYRAEAQTFPEEEKEACIDSTRGATADAPHLRLFHCNDNQTAGRAVRCARNEEITASQIHSTLSLSDYTSEFSLR